MVPLFFLGLDISINYQLSKSLPRVIFATTCGIRNHAWFATTCGIINHSWYQQLLVVALHHRRLSILVINTYTTNVANREWLLIATSGC